MLLANAPVLRAPNYERPFLLAVDASAYGAGAVLLQEDVKGIEHPVSYLKKKSIVISMRILRWEKRL